MPRLAGVIGAILLTTFLVLQGLSALGWAQPAPTCEQQLPYWQGYAGYLAQGRNQSEQDLVRLRLQVQALNAELRRLQQAQEVPKEAPKNE